MIESSEFRRFIFFALTEFVSILILYIPVGMYMQKYISLLSAVQSQPTHIHLQHVIRLPVSAQKSHHEAYDRNYEKQTPCIL
jgi:hypothetical protein